MKVIFSDESRIDIGQGDDAGTFRRKQINYQSHWWYGVVYMAFNTTRHFTVHTSH